MKDWIEGVYATVRYWVDPKFRRTVKMYRAYIEAALEGTSCTCYWAVIDGEAEFRECDFCGDW